MMKKITLAPLLALVGALSFPATAWAVASSELYQNETYTYGRFEARIRFAPGDGVVSSFFLWKPGSEVAGTFWNELDFEKLEEDCRMQTNPLYGNPVIDNGEIETVSGDLCGGYHTYTFEWTPSYISWLIDGVEVRREEGPIAEAFEQNAASGMQFRFNIWPGDVTFGGDFDPAILPVHQYVSWAQYSSFQEGTFEVQWREDFSGGALPAGWAVGNWESPKGYSTHNAANVTFTSSGVVLSLTADDALGFEGEPPMDPAVDSDGADTPGGSANPDGDSLGGGVDGSRGDDTSPGEVDGDGTTEGATEDESSNDSAGGAGTSDTSAPPSTREAAGSDSGGCSLGARKAPSPTSSLALLLASGLLLALGRRRRGLGRRSLVRE